MISTELGKGRCMVSVAPAIWRGIFCPPNRRVHLTSIFSGAPLATIMGKLYPGPRVALPS
jgi:hypothetical protein